MSPNYKQIYLDIITEKYPEKMDDIRLKTKIDNILTATDVLFMNNLVFGDKACKVENSKLRSYDENSIRQILDFQRKNNLNNSQLAKHFRLSRNSISKWRKIF